MLPRSTGSLTTHPIFPLQCDPKHYTGHHTNNTGSTMKRQHIVIVLFTLLSTWAWAKQPAHDFKVTVHG